MAKRSKADGGEREQTELVLQVAEREMEQFRGKTITAIEVALAHLPGAHNEPPPTMVEIFDAHCDAGMKEQLMANLRVATRIRERIAAEINRLQGVATSAGQTPALALLFLQSLGPLLGEPTQRESWMEAMVRECRQVPASLSERSVEQPLLFLGLGWKAHGSLSARARREHEKVRMGRSKAGRSTARSRAAWWDILSQLVRGEIRKHPHNIARDEILDYAMAQENKALQEERIKKPQKRDTLERGLVQRVPSLRSRKSRQT
jgi:hypothetical protein